MKPRMTAAEAECRVRTDTFTTAAVISRLLGVSMNLIYAGIRDGSVPSVKVGSKVRIPSATYRAMLPPEAAVPPHDTA